MGKYSHRRCPICHTGTVVRPDSRTCGARECKQEWIGMSREQRGLALEYADEPDSAAKRAKILGGKLFGQPIKLDELPKPTDPDAANLKPEDIERLMREAEKQPAIDIDNKYVNKILSTINRSKLPDDPPKSENEGNDNK